MRVCTRWTGCPCRNAGCAALVSSHPTSHLQPADQLPSPSLAACSYVTEWLRQQASAKVVSTDAEAEQVGSYALLHGGQSSCMPHPSNPPYAGKFSSAARCTAQVDACLHSPLHLRPLPHLPLPCHSSG